ncbi:DUF4142 domain-containing protein [Streptosporangium pseudovulgare]|uniref:DUF4142 domain-containing protein n=1 Tax=Streptosporangium pseudovulgare TaxID=35765 RepID=A0ABQ2RJ64_9ACTN|nr:DUF4142 domain-containing protein [Streptosporangium pseudovulgare]GGQ29731.1 hypothetical protein GCM10010140_69950 [Streptosporangium pseudovulgare]
MIRRIVVLLAAMLVMLGGAVQAAVAQPNVNEQDRKFLVQAHRGNLAEILSSRLALKKSDSQDIKNIAQKLITDHTTLDGKLRAVAERASVQLPGRPNEKQREQIDKLSKLSGSSFDNAWLAAQAASHRMTLKRIDQELADGSSLAVKKLAEGAKPIIREHLRLVREARASESPVPSGSPS